MEYPENLDDLLKDSETRRDEALEVQQALPGLTRLASERTKLADAEQLRSRLSRQLSDKMLARPDVFKAQQHAQTAFKEDETHEKKMRDALTEANTYVGAARQQLDNFNKVVGAAKCRYCGSELTEKHNANENQRLMDDLKEKEGLATSANENHDRSTHDLGRADELRQKTSDDLRRLEGEIESITQSLGTCEQNIGERLAAIEMTFDALPVTYQAKICLSKPASVDAWAETVYPQSSDIEALKETIAKVSECRAESTRFLNQVENRNRTHTQCKSIGETLVATQKTLPTNWEELRAEHFSLKNSIGVWQSVSRVLNRKQKMRTTLGKKQRKNFRRFVIGSLTEAASWRQAGLNYNGSGKA